MEIKLYDCETSAQAVTKVCYNEKTRNLNFRIECKDLQDLKKCVEIIKSYNNFDWMLINNNLPIYTDFENEKGSLLTYEIGRESSPVIYIKWCPIVVSPRTKVEYVAKDDKLLTFTQEEFEKNIRALAAITFASECQFEEDGMYNVCRLWWD